MRRTEGQINEDIGNRRMKLRDADMAAGDYQAMKAQIEGEIADLEAEKTTALRTVFLDYDARRDPKTQEFCIRCQRDFKPNQPRRWVHIVDGGGMVLHPEDETEYVSDGGDMNFFEIGADCAKIIGKDFTWPPEALPKPAQRAAG